MGDLAARSIAIARNSIAHRYTSSRWKLSTPQTSVRTHHGCPTVAVAVAVAVNDHVNVDGAQPIDLIEHSAYLITLSLA